MKTDFTKLHERYQTNSVKWDFTEELFGEKNLLPMWIADMDFPSPPAIIEAMVQRAAHGIYGYTDFDEEFWSVVRTWYKKKHGWDIPPDSSCYSPGIVTSLSIAVDCFSRPGDSIIIMPPVYHPFYEVIQNNGRRVEKNSLLLKDNRYYMDFDHLEKIVQSGTSLLILCNPHNPGGRVWSKAELSQLGEICLRYKVLVISDEIHGDLTFPGSAYTPYASISTEMAQNSVTCLAPNKTFNIPGLQSSFVVIPNWERRSSFKQRLKALALTMPNCFAPAAVKACYQQGGAWLEEVLQYIKGNLETALQFFAQKLPVIKPMRPEGTYLLWIDCRDLGLAGSDLKELMYHQAKVAFSEGSIFGSEGEGYLRINLACPRTVLLEGLERFAQAVGPSSTG